MASPGGPVLRLRNDPRALYPSAVGSDPSPSSRVVLHKGSFPGVFPRGAPPQLARPATEERSPGYVPLRRRDPAFSTVLHKSPAPWLRTTENSLK